LVGGGTGPATRDVGGDWSSKLGFGDGPLLPPPQFPVSTGGASGPVFGVAGLAETAKAVACTSGAVVGSAWAIAGIDAIDVAAAILGSGVSTCGGSKITKLFICHQSVLIPVHRDAHVGSREKA
jgi:hypothetical protein